MGTIGTISIVFAEARNLASCSGECSIRSQKRFPSTRVSPRDGLQNESAQVATHGKVRLIESLVNAGLKRIEIGSFVSATWVPQMADGDQVCRLVGSHPGVVFSALCPNKRGLERAQAAGVPEIAVFISASETHNQKNVNKSVSRYIARLRRCHRPGGR